MGYGAKVCLGRMFEMKFIKNLTALKPQNSIKYLLHSYLNGPEKARPLSRIHASDMTKPEGLCPRMYALADVTKLKPKDQWLTTSEQVTFKMGRDLQDSVVNWFADMGKAFCHWRCYSCERLHEYQLRPHKCQKCQSVLFKPEEVRFKSVLTGASCGVDMLLVLGESKMLPVELKTMAADQFKTLLAPLAEHRWRTNLYLRIIAESDTLWAASINTEKATILYISKAGYGCADPQLSAWGLSEKFSPFKEYEIARKDNETDAIMKRAKAVYDYRAGKHGMPAGICSTSLISRAQSCSFRSVCFSGDYPATHEWQDK